MRIKSLGIRNLRLFPAVDIPSFGQFNLIYGPNASGKTSLLEAIYLLATSRSFRTNNMLDLLRHGSEVLQVTAKVLDAQGRSVALGLERSRDSLVLRAAGKRVTRASELAQWLPAQIVHPDSHQLISGGPKGRRRFLDWGVFHVEPGFPAIWRRYDKALKQRNASLRARASGSLERVWDSEMNEAALEIERMRRRYVEELSEILPGFITALMGPVSFELQYHPGWDQNHSLLEELAHNLGRDRKRGFTCSGPHRADLIFVQGTQRAAQVISRGQQKMLVVALFLAQAELLTRRTGRSSVLLFDDLAAELDEVHRRRALEVLERMAVQVFITALDKDVIQASAPVDVKRFHVEHGHLMEVV
ncbi:MAG TPA: DNA replication/repair protein RecF [Gammaproteobacteria bacterium]|nr:DNA replication/repair protein RecF [Gammaproteobacteria bacterium]